MSKNTYKPDLEDFISQCELNYFLILKILPFLNIKNNSEIKAQCSEQVIKHAKSGQQIFFDIVEKAKYTTTIMLRLSALSNSSQIALDLMVRLYHDAKLLEVMDKMGPKALLPVVKGKNLKYAQIDEKRQLNRFVGESLKFCLANRDQMMTN